MNPPKLLADFTFLPEMYHDGYFPDEQVDKVKAAIQKVVSYLEDGNTDTKKIQRKLDKMTQTINALQEDFEDHDSEI